MNYKLCYIFVCTMLWNWRIRKFNIVSHNYIKKNTHLKIDRVHQKPERFSHSWKGSIEIFSSKFRNHTSFRSELAYVPGIYIPETIHARESKLYWWPALNFCQERSHIQMVKKQEVQIAFLPHPGSCRLKFLLGKLEDYNGAMC